MPKSTTGRKFLKKVFLWIRNSWFLNLVRSFNCLVRKFASATHHFQKFLEWYVPPDKYEWFEHHIDMYYLWEKTLNPLWVERGVFNLLALPPNGRVLELACGDGFNSRHFYSIRSSKIKAVDFDPTAIRYAKKYNRTANVEFILADIRKDLPIEKFDAVILDAAIEHLNNDETNSLLANLKKRLLTGGVFMGYTLVERPDGKKCLEQHEREFKSKEALANLLSPFFKNVKIFETIYQSRHNLYFYASDGVLPFDKDWQYQTVIQ